MIESVTILFIVLIFCCAAVCECYAKIGNKALNIAKKNVAIYGCLFFLGRNSLISASNSANKRAHEAPCYFLVNGVFFTDFSCSK